MVWQFSGDVAGFLDDERLVASGWAVRIAPEAANVLALLNLRGRRREEAEEPRSS